MKARLIATLMFTFFLTLTIFYSCSKDDNMDNPDSSPEQILTGKSWKIDKIRSLRNNVAYYYERGSSNHELDNEYITFNSDHTGVYTANNGTQYQITSWSFTDSQKTKIEYTVVIASPLVVNWENVAITKNDIRYGEYYTETGTHSMSIATRIPK